MDTNQRTANNYQINTFVKGMNSDTSYDMIGADQYLFGLNIRITNNTLLLGDLDSNNTEMVVAPIPKGDNMQFITGSHTEQPAGTKILAVDSIENVGVLIMKLQNNHWKVYRVEKEGDYTNIKCTAIYTSTETTTKDRFSVTMIKEVEDVIKVYIADGGGAPVCLFLKNKDTNIYDFYNPGNTPIETGWLRIGAYFPNKKLRLQKASGNLKTQQVQYTYRFYKEYGYVSKLAPLTNKIHVINSNRNLELGNAEDTITNVGFNLFIPNPTVDIFDYLQVFRVSYIKYGQAPEIDLIYDKKLQTNVLNNQQRVKDDGNTSLQKYSPDEFSALQFQYLSPEIIESNQGYLFVADILDGTILDSTDYSGIDVTTQLTSFDITLDSSLLDGIPENDNALIEDSEHNPDIESYFEGCGINLVSEDGNTAKLSYNDMFASSLLRSLRYDEKYDYGIVYYDKYGRHSDVQHLTTINTSSLGSSPTSTSHHSTPFGVEFTIGDFSDTNIVGFEIVRQEKNYNNTKNLLLVALSRPVRQGKYGDNANTQYRTPYYPNILLTSQFVYYQYIVSNLQDGFGELYDLYFDHNATNVENFTLFLAFSPAINFYRNDILSTLTGEFITLHPIWFRRENVDCNSSAGVISMSETKSTVGFRAYHHPNSGSGYTSHLENSGGTITNNNKYRKIYTEDGLNSKYNIDLIRVPYLQYSVNNKTTLCTIFKLGDGEQNEISSSDVFEIKNVKDVKNPNWEDAFSALQFDSSNVNKITTGIKQYKSYNTIIGKHEYNNWASGGMYDLAVGQNDASSQPGNSSSGTWVFNTKNGDNWDGGALAQGWIGPGPVCLLLELNEWDDYKLENGRADNALEKHFKASSTVTDQYVGTLVCTIQHQIPETTYRSTDPYFGFGNYFNFSDFTPDSNGKIKVRVFDGDVYNDYGEFTNLFKTYNFNDKRFSLKSGQVVYYIPMESEVNVRFDYGCNYRNTNSSNLMLEPGKITGVSSQDRPLHQYNRIYSDNNTSINVFYEDSQHDEVKTFLNRISYSLLKTNGELIDNWQIFKPADFIDTDSRYGAVTHLLSKDSNIYFWQTGAFGKLSVNERSLVTDNNGETIQLGQGGVLQRTDYLSTKYGMRKQDFCAVNAEDAIFWIDILNKAVLMCKQGQVVNYGEMLNVQNYINSAMTENIPTIHYDLLTSELLCRAFDSASGNLQQLVFNTKLGLAQSVYTRIYDDIICFNNTLCSISMEGSGGYTTFRQLNYLKNFILVDATFSRYITIDDVYTGRYHYYDTECPDDEQVICWEQGECKFRMISPSREENLVLEEWSVYSHSNDADTEATLTYLNGLVLNNVNFCIYFDDGTQRVLYYHSNQALTAQQPVEYLTPTVIEIAVNSSASQTKVFDNQKVVILKKDRSEASITNLMPEYLSNEHSAFIDSYLSNRSYNFETDLQSTTNKPIAVTDREGNICYTFPRTTSVNASTSFNNQTSYGGRMRGKWLRERITNSSPKKDECISHIITKFRQSYS